LIGMSIPTTVPEVLTLDEAAEYLRVPAASLQALAEQGAVPARCINAEWRFLRAAIDDWLRGRNALTSLIRQAGALAHDESLAALREAIYKSRGRPEAADPSAA
jgi:excisionase family DNA binding protein